MKSESFAENPAKNQPFSIFTDAFVEEAIEDKNKHGNGMENHSGQFSLLKQFV
jgi:hypothetical protein